MPEQESKVTAYVRKDKSEVSGITKLQYLHGHANGRFLVAALETHAATIFLFTHLVSRSTAWPESGRAICYEQISVMEVYRSTAQGPIQL